MLHRALHVAVDIPAGQKGVAAGDGTHEKESSGGQGEGARGGEADETAGT